MWLRHYHQHHFPPTNPDPGQIRNNSKIFMACRSQRHIYKQKIRTEIKRGRAGLRGNSRTGAQWYPGLHGKKTSVPKSHIQGTCAPRKPFPSEQFSTDLLPPSAACPMLLLFMQLNIFACTVFPGISKRQGWAGHSGSAAGGRATLLFPGSPVHQLPARTFTAWKRDFPWKLAPNLIATGFFFL